MLQAPSHLSRVCGHGHIKKFWLMQTQKESQSCDSKSSSVLFTPSSTSRCGNRASLKGVDSSPWSTPSPLASIPGYGDSPTSAKHPSFTCAETLSSPSLFCKAVLPQSPYSTLSAEGIAQVKNASEPHMKNTSEILAEDTCRAVSEDALRSTSSPRMSPLNVVSEHERKPSLEPSNSLTEEESLSSEGIRRSEDPLSFSADDSTNSITSQGHSPPIQNVKGLYIGAEVHKVNPTLKFGGCSSPARTNIGVRDKVGDEKAVSNIVWLSVPGAAVVSALESGKYYGAGIASRSRDNSVDGSYLAPLMSGLKTCTLCGTTKTPMWRSGPQGPKSLCNACGIRYKKYRTVPGQNGSPEHGVSSLAQISSKALARPLKRKHNSAVPTCEPPRPQKISFKSGVADAVPVHQKKVNWHELAMRREQVEHNRGNLQRWRNTSAPHTCFKKIYGCAPFQSKFKKLAPLDEHRSVSRVFAKDEEEAAVLLMHLSCGLVY